MFAVDSIPAIFAVTTDTFVVFTSNVFALLGMRALYFLLAGAAERFRYLHVGLGVILAFVGVKLLVSDLWHPPTWTSLAVIAAVLGGTLAASLRADRADRAGRAEMAAGRAPAGRPGLEIEALPDPGPDGEPEREFARSTGGV